MTAVAAARAAASVRSVNPATLDVVWEARVASDEEITEAVAAAGAAQKAWRGVTVADRRRRFDALVEVLLERADEIARTITAETGKPLVESYSSELFVAGENARWIGRNAERVVDVERLRTPRLIAFKRGRVLNEPLGVVGVIYSWNYPLGVPFTQVAAVVGTGNAAVLKPSELTPLTGRTHGMQGRRELVSPKYVDEDSGRVRVLWWYPYGADGIDGLKGGLELLYRKTPGARARGAAAHRSGLVRLTRRYLGRR